jgi:hypothetical protein
LFGQTGSTTRKRGSGRPTKRTLEVINAVEELMENEPKISLRYLFQQVIVCGDAPQIVKKEE